MTDNIDPFDQIKAPSLSFKDAAIGTSYTGVVDDSPNLVQSRDFDTGDLATWPDGNPKMSAVINLIVGGELRSLWAQKPSALFAAITEARQSAGVPIAKGGTLTVTYIGDKPNATNPRLNPAKQYRVTYTAPNADAFASVGAGAASAVVDDEPPF